MKKIFNTGIILWVVWCLTGCYEDKGDYDYDWVTNVNISGIEKSYTYSVGDAFVLRPTLQFAKKDAEGLPGVEDNFSEHEYAYYWIAERYDKYSGLIQYDTISRERNLNYIVNLPAGEYLMVYQICNSTAQIIWSTRFKLNVTMSAPEGWLLLEDNAGSAELSIYARMGDGTMRMVRNMLTNAGIPADRLVGPRQVFATYQTQVGNGVWVLTDHFTGHLDVKSGHTWTERQTIGNYIPETVGNDFVFNKMQGVMFHTVFGFSDDGLRVARYPAMLYTGDLLPVNERRFDVAPYVAAMGSEMQTKQVLLFDRTHRCFKYLDISGDYNWMDADENFPVGYDLKYMAVVGEVGAQKIYALLTGEEGVYEMVASSSTEVELKARRMSTSEKFMKAKQCVYHQFLHFPYYLYEGKLYVNRAENDEREVEYYRTPEAGDEAEAGEAVIPTELEGNIVYITTVPFSDLNMEGYEHRRGFMNYVIVTTELEDGSGKVYFLTPEAANAQKLTITDVVDTYHKVISIDYQRPGI